jgi:hypothetical protein
VNYLTAKGVTPVPSKERHLLRLSGLAPDQALATLKRTRAVTADGVTDDRLAFVELALTSLDILA